MGIEDIALTMTPGLGVRGAVRLLECFGDARTIFSASREELVHFADLRPDVADAVAARRGFAPAEREAEYCRRHGIVALASTDAEYPDLLRNIPDYPHILYVRGSVAALSGRCVALVGTRAMTAYGQEVCSRIVADLAACVPRLTVVSGLAFGIDAACHRAALAADVPTVGVVANALPEVTPAQHVRLAEEMIARGGAVVTELSSRTKQNGGYYVARNRLIAALGAGTVVVESDVRGGALITAKSAHGYDRTVMAVPGRITDRCSRGTNHLICTQVAVPVRSGREIAEALRWEFGLPAEPAPSPAAAATPDLTADDRRVLGCFRDDDPLAFDVLVERSGLDAGSLNALLVGLEFGGAVRQLPGNRYRKLIELP